MLKFLPFILIIALRSPALGSSSKRLPAVTPTPTATPIPSPTPISGPLAPNHITFTCGATCTADDKLMLIVSESKINSVEASDCFHDFIVNPANKLDLGQTNGLSAEQVVTKIRSTDAQLTLTFYWQAKSIFSSWYVDGFEDPSNLSVTHINRASAQALNFKACDYASTEAHEEGHVLLFEHDYNPTARRPYSVNYMINSAFLSCCKN